MPADSIGYVAELPNGKQVLFLDCPPQETIKMFQRWDAAGEWDPINPMIFDHTKLPKDTIIQAIP